MSYAKHFPKKKFKPFCDQLEYVRYGIEMQKGTQKALRNQQKTIAKRKNNIRNIGSKTIYKK